MLSCEYFSVINVKGVARDCKEMVYLEHIYVIESCFKDVIDFLILRLLTFFIVQLEV